MKVEVQGVGIVDFPEDAQPDEISKALNQHFPNPKTSGGGMTKLVEPGVTQENTLDLIHETAEDLGAKAMNLVGPVPVAYRLATGKPLAEPGKPLVNIPSVPISGMGLKLLSPETAAGVDEEAGKLISGFTTPGAVATLPAAATSKLVEAYYALQSARDIPAGIKRVSEAKNPKELGAAVLGTGANIAMTGLMAKGVVRKEPALTGTGIPYTPPDNAPPIEAPAGRSGTVEVAPVPPASESVVGTPKPSLATETGKEAGDRIPEFDPDRLGVRERIAKKVAEGKTREQAVAEATAEQASVDQWIESNTSGGDVVQTPDGRVRWKDSTDGKWYDLTEKGVRLTVMSGAPSSTLQGGRVIRRGLSMREANKLGSKFVRKERGGVEYYEFDDSSTSEAVGEAPKALTADAVLSQPPGSTSATGIAELPNEEFNKLVDAKDEKGARRYSITQDATAWGMKQSPDIVPELERLRDEAGNKSMAEYENRNFDHRDRSQWFSDAIHAITKDEVGQKNIATLTGKPVPEEVPTRAGTTDTPPAVPELVGMGGAVASEFEKSPNTPTSIKNATVDVERQKRGLPPAIQPVKKAFGAVWDQAMAKIDHDPGAQDALIDELRNKPRALTDVEDATLLHRQIDLQNEYGKATRDLAQAFDDNRPEAVVEEKARVARLSDQLLDLYNIGKKVGTETGRGLNARKMMAYEDFSLANMELQKRAANEGRPLTDAERSELQALHEKIAATQKAHDEYVAATEQRIADMEVKAALDRAEREAKSQPTVNPYILSVAEKLVANLDKRAEAARERLKQKMGRVSAGVDPTILFDLAEIGASHIGHLGLDFAKWSSRMVDDVGDWVKPHLEQVFAESQKVVDSSTDRMPNQANAPKVRRALKKLDVSERIADTAEKIKTRVAEGKTDEISSFVQRLARYFVEKGIKDREQVIDEVHGVLKQFIPEITRREAMDAISGYGDFKPLTKDEISVQLRGIKGEMQQIAKLEDMAKGVPPRKTGVERRTPTEEERRLIKAVNEAKVQFQVPITDPATQLKSALDTRKIQLRNKTNELQEKLANGDFDKKPRRELKLDAEAMRLKADADRAKQDFQKALTADRMKKRTLLEKAQDTFVKWRRGFILSSPVTLAKLTSAAVQRLAFTPMEEAVGAGISKLIPEVAAKAPREGNISLKAEAKAITEGLTKGMSDAWQVLKTGRSDLDVAYGKAVVVPPTAVDFIGHIHGALKTVAKRAEFARSFQKRVEASLRDGIDPTDPMVQSKIAIEAYKDSNRSIFQQDNRVVSAYKRALSAFDQPDKATGKIPVSSKIAGTALRTVLPIVKIPTNIVAETMQYATGLVTGSARLANAFRKGIDTLPPEQADLIMRELKKGSLGAAVMLIGFLNPQVIGGYYQQGQKRDGKDLKPGTIRLYGHDIPSFLLHNPLLETLQLGATVRRVADSKLKRSDSSPQGIGAGIWAGALGLAEEVPFVRETLDFSKAFNPNERNAFLGELARSTFVPQLFQWLATQQDKDKYGQPIKRKPETLWQQIKMGIPGLRQTVPKNPKQ